MKPNPLEADLTADQKDEMLRKIRSSRAYSKAYEDIEFMRNRALAEVEIGAKDAQNKFDDAMKRRKMLDGELEFYKKKPVPPSLKEQIKSADTEIKAQQIALDAKTKDREKVNNRFDEEKKRYLELTQGGKSAVTSSAADGAAASSTSDSARPR